MRLQVKHKKHGKGRIADVDGDIMDSLCLDGKEIRIFIEWDNKKSILAGWYNTEDPNLSFPE